MAKQSNKNDLYEVLKEAGFLYFYIASCISSDNPSTIQSCQERLASLKDLLSSVPESEAEDRKRVQQGIDVLERELSNIKNMTRVLFLDFDGVLNTEKYQARLREKGKTTLDAYGPLFDPNTVKNLRRIVEAVPDLKIVIISSWKLEGLGYIRELWEVRKLPGKIVDVTPDYVPDLSAIDLDAENDITILAGKGNEIKQWLEQNAPENCKYVILDDVPDFLPEQETFLRLVDPRTGLTKPIADRIIGYMRYEYMTEDEQNGK